jgi:hypothetical protein
MKTKKMTDAQREAKRERDRRYRAKKREEARANKPTKKTAKKQSTDKTVVAKNLKLKVALVKGSAKNVSPKHKAVCAPLKERVRVSLIALSALCKFMAAGI